MELPTATELTGPRITLDPALSLCQLAFEAACQDELYRRFGYFSSLKHVSPSEIEPSERLWTLIGEESNIAGLLELHLASPEHGWVELGYWISEPNRGKGFASEALRLLTTWLTDCTEAVQADLIITPANSRSIKVAKRAGYEHRGSAHVDHEIDGSRLVEIYSRSLKADDLPPADVVDESSD